MTLVRIYVYPRGEPDIGRPQAGQWARWCGLEFDPVSSVEYVVRGCLE